MKKKVKLITTIASLCLAVALMAFGVYAATNVAMSISSTVSFTVTDVFVDITGSVTLGGSAVSEKAFTATSYLGTVANAELNNKTWTIDDVAFTSDDDVIVYTLTIANAAKSGNITVTFSAVPTAVTGTDVTYTKQVTGDENAVPLTTEAITVGAQKTLTVVVTRTLTDKTTDFSKLPSWNTNVAIANV